jgi:hypothetical protein
MTFLHLLQSLNLHQYLHFVTNIKCEVAWWWTRQPNCPSLYLRGDTCWISSTNKIEASAKIENWILQCHCGIVKLTLLIAIINSNTMTKLISHQGLVDGHDSSSLQLRPARISGPPSPYGQACIHLWNLMSMWHWQLSDQIRCPSLGCQSHVLSCLITKSFKLCNVQIIQTRHLFNLDLIFFWRCLRQKN